MNELQMYDQNHELQLPQETRELLKTVFEQGTAPNTLKAHRRDVETFWQWANVGYGAAEVYAALRGFSVRRNSIVGQRHIKAA